MDDPLEEDYKISYDKYISGTLIWYYKICRRELWFMARELMPEQDNPLLDLGRAIHETSYESLPKEVKLEGVKFDIYIKGRKTVCEVKTSSKFLDAATLQVKYYLYRLKLLGVDASGMVLVPREKKRYRVTLSDDDISELKRIFRDIKELVYSEKPPPPIRIKFCRKCAYKDFCWV